MNRLQMGMKNASSIFQKVVERCIDGLPGTVAYQDDILIYASTEASLRKRLTFVKNKLDLSALMVKPFSSVEIGDNIQFLGYHISADGIKPDLRLVQKVQSIKSPTNIKVGTLCWFGEFLRPLYT